MNLWTMIVLIVAFGAISEMYRARLKVNAKLEESQGREDELNGRIESLEERLKNLETIVLEHEKLRDFDRSLS